MKKNLVSACRDAYVASLVKGKAGEDHVCAVVTGWHLTALILDVDLENPRSAFAYVINHYEPECSELGYVDLREYEMTGMMKAPTFQPCSLEEAKAQYLL